MKIIEKGTKEKWGIELICTGAGNNDNFGACHSKLLVEENDIFQTRSTDITGDTEIYYTFECPVCKAWTDIDSRKLPGWIQEKASKRIRYPSSRNHFED